MIPSKLTSKPSRKLLVNCLIPALVMCLVMVSTALAGQLEDKLIDAARKGDMSNVRVLLAKGANIEAKDDFDCTALIRAAENGHTKVVKLLLSKGANIEAKDNEGSTALMDAAFYGHADTVKLLLEKGANIEAKDNFGETPLMYAAKGGHEVHKGIVKFLIEKGADLNAKNNKGYTALMLAADYAKKDVVLLLAFDQGIAAAQRQDWTAAADYFEQGYKFAERRKEPPALLFNLGLANSKIPGRELHAMLWFKLYLHCQPHAANADAVRQELASLKSSAEATLGNIDGLKNEIEEPMKELAPHLDEIQRQVYATCPSMPFVPCNGNNIYPDFENEWGQIKGEMDCEKDFNDIRGAIMAISRHEDDDPSTVCGRLYYISDALHFVLRDLSRLGN